MKRRNSVNKFTIGNNGEIKNNKPRLSKKTQQLISMMGMLEALSSEMASSSDDVVEEDVYDRDEAIDAIKDVDDVEKVKEVDEVDEVGVVGEG